MTGHWVAILGYRGFPVLGWSCHDNWPQPSCPWESNPTALRISQTSGDWGQEGPASQLCPEQVLSPSEYISWVNFGAPSPLETPPRQPQAAASCKCAESSVALGLLSSVRRRLPSPKGRTIECSQRAEERSGLITWSAAILPSKESRLQVRKGKATR